MNNKIKELAEQAGYLPDSFGIGHWDMPECKKFAELIIAELRGVLTKEYLDTQLECCGHFLRLDEAILDHFYGLDDAPKT